MARFNPTFTTEELANEIWKPAPEWEGLYEVSNLGRVRRVAFGGKNNGGARAGYILSQSGQNYAKVIFRNRPRKETPNVHKLVALAFHGPRPTPQHEVNHKDTNKLNNRLDNLEYLTKPEHIAHTMQTGRILYRKNWKHIP